MLPATREGNNIYSYATGGYNAVPALPVVHQQAPEKAGIRIWELVRDHWILLTVAMVACGGAAYCASLWMTPVYRASAQIEIGDPSQDVLSQNRTMQQDMSSDSYFQTQIEILSSRSLLARVSDRLHLEERFKNTAKPATSGWSGLVSALRPHTEPIPARDQAVALLRDHLDILPPRGLSRLITVQFDAEDRNLAAQVPNTIGDEFIKQDLELRQKSNSHTSEWLSGELEGLRARLRDSEQALQAYSQSAGLMAVDPDQETVAQARLRELQDDLSKAQADRISKEAFENLARKGDPATTAALLDSGPLRDYSVKLADAEQQLAKLQAIFTPNHYKVKQAEAEIESIRLAMEGERSNVLSRASNSYQAAALREKMLTSAFNSQATTVSAQDARTARYNLLKREVESNRQIYDTILGKVKSVQVDASLRPDNILIVDAAEPPIQPYKPNPELNAGAGATAGLLLSGVFALVLTRRDRRFRTPEAAVQYLNVPELGVIPSLDSDKPLKTSNFLTLRRGEEREDADLVKLTGAPSAITDSFRAAVASILFACAGRRGSLALTVTSAAAKEGKTTVTASLAVVLAQMKHRVLVIDGDVRKPRLHALFGLENQKGLTDLLADTRGWEKGIWNEYVKPTAFPNLSIITSGRSSAPHVEILDGPKIESLVALVRSNFDMILIDTPPVLDLADARIFSRLSDGVIVVCKASATDPDAARGATRRLQSDGSNILGTILTDMPGGTSNYNGSYYHKDGKGDRRQSSPWWTKKPYENPHLGIWMCAGERLGTGVGWNWARYLAHDHEVWVLLPESERAAFAPEAIEKEGVRLVFCDLPSWLRLSNQNTLVRYHLHYHSWQILAYFVARRLHAEVQFDLVHHLVLGTHWKPSFLSFLPIPFVWGPLGGGEVGPASFVRRFPLKERLNEWLRDLVRRVGEGDPFVRLTAQRSSLALAKTNQTATRLRALGAVNVEVMSEAGLSQQELARLSQIPQRSELPFRVISIGRLLHWKGFEFGLQAFAALIKRFPESEYWLVGDGPYRSRLSALAEELGVSQKVFFLGSISREEAMTKLASCDVLIHPSIHDSGGWTCLEAMAAGKPVVCLDLGGPAAQVTPETGFLVRADDPDRATDEMGQILASLAASPKLRMQTGMAGRVHVQKHFAWERKSQDMQERYNRFAIQRALATAD